MQKIKKYYKCENCGQAFDEYESSSKYMCKKCDDAKKEAEFITQYDNCYENGMKIE